MKKRMFAASFLVFVGAGANESNIAIGLGGSGTVQLTP